MVFEKLKEIIARQLDIDTDAITPGTDLAEDLHADSLDKVEMIMNAEDEFGIEIDDNSAIGFKTIGDVVAYIESHIGNK